MDVRKRNIGLTICMICAAIILAVIGIYKQSLEISKLEESLDKEMLQIEEAKIARDASEKSFADVRDKAMNEKMKIEGVVLDKDMEVIKEVLTPAYNWTSNEEYDLARSTLEKTLPEDSLYLKNIMPDRRYADRSGKTRNLTKEGLKCYCDNIQIYPAYKNDEGSVSYYVIMDYISYKNDDIQKHDHLTVDRQILTAKMNSEHKLIDIELEQCDSIVNYRTRR